MLRSNDIEQIRTALPLIKVLPEEAQKIMISSIWEIVGLSSELTNSLGEVISKMTDEGYKHHWIDSFLNISQFHSDIKAALLNSIGQIAATLTDESYKKSIVTDNLIPCLKGGDPNLSSSAAQAIGAVLATISDETYKKSIISKR